MMFVGLMSTRSRMTRFRKWSLTKFCKRQINDCNETERLFDSRCIARLNPMQCSALVAISPRPCQMIVASGCYRRDHAEWKVGKGSHGRGHDQMPGYGPRHPHRTGRGQRKLPCDAGLLQPRLLPDLPNPTRMACAGGVGVRGRAG